MRDISRSNAFTDDLLVGHRALLSLRAVDAGSAPQVGSPDVHRAIMRGRVAHGAASTDIARNSASCRRDGARPKRSHCRVAAYHRDRDLFAA
ncbi:MAG TPA: hypothetical protein VK571_07700 [Gemmatimonadaceae bacterium]|nr:hypothetical protein [Gemmatimonadaceae bacterium]